MSLNQPRKPLVAAIIPAYKEERNISTILDVLHRTDILYEIIVVDDGSPDRTAEIIREYEKNDPRIRLIRHETNKGKGQAIFSGWAATSAPYIILLDADLKNLRPEQVASLIEPIIENRADMTLGLFLGGHLHTDFAHWATPFLTGQRGIRTDLLKHVSRAASVGYGFEIALTIAVGQEGYRTRIVPLRGVWHPPSEFHRGLWFGIKTRGRMYGQIIRAWYIATCERHPKMRDLFSPIMKL